MRIFVRRGTQFALDAQLARVSRGADDESLGPCGTTDRQPRRESTAALRAFGGSELGNQR